MKQNTESGENKKSTGEVNNQGILRIFDHADDPVLSVEEIAEELPISNDSISYHLKSMEQEGLLGSKKVGENSVAWWAETAPEPSEERKETSESSGRKSAVLNDNKELRQIIDLVPDPLYVKNLDDEVLLSNEANAELHGMTPEEMEGKRELDIESDVENIEDFDKYRQREIEVIQKGGPITFEENLTDPDGNRHTFRITRIPFGGTTEDEDTILGYARDVTELKQRERELRWERELNRSIQQEMATSRSRDGLERKVTDQLQSHGYATAWAAERSGDALVPRTLGGSSRYIEEIDWTLGSTKHHSEPCLRASRNGTPQFEHSTESRSEDWCEVAEKYSYRSCAAVPIIHNGVTYGVLAVYHEDPNRFDSLERKMLEKIADTVALAIDRLEKKTALSADQTLEVTVHVGRGYYLADLARDGVFADHEEVTVHGTVSIRQDKAAQYLGANKGSVLSLQERFANHPEVQDTAVVGDGERLRLEVTGRTPELELASENVVVKESTVENGDVVIRAQLSTREKLRSVVDSLKERFSGVSIKTAESVEEHGGDSATGGRGLGDPDLTEKQLAAVEAAYFSGYFAQPRDSSATEVAELLGVSHSTFLRHLRSAQDKIFRERFEQQQ
jgi:PAS domain S-box-containing protein